jgi:predicted ATPase/DNA-binding CsgD family transcriptional regulator
MAVSVASRRRANLPVELTSFVGRRQEVADVRRSLSESRLVTLTGVGGVGKTRLALRVAAELHRAFRDGVWLVDLAGLSDPMLLEPAVASALGLRDATATWQASRLADHLADMQVLLVLDNCEHMVTECALLVDVLLRSCPELRVLATSRQGLGIIGERTIRVPSLSVPRPEQPPPAAQALMQYEAVSLLAERAAAVLPGFSVSPDNHEAVARLCQRLDGIPLAIELAAVRLRALSVDQVLDRLDDRYGLLRTTSPAAMPRQQTLRALIDWSFDLLSAQEQLLWSRLSVFAGSFELDAAEVVCGDGALPADSIAELVAGLVDKSVLIREDRGPRVRYRLLETMRQYGLERQRRSGEEAELRRRHRDWFLRLAIQTERERFGRRQLAGYDRLRAEHPNLRAALEYCLTEPGAAGDGQRTAAALQTFWVVDGAIDEGRRWLRRLLAVDSTPGVDRARALASAGRLAVLQGDVADVPTLLAECRDLVHPLADDALSAHLAHTEGLAELFSGEPQRAVELFEHALAVHRAHGDLFGTSLALTQLANTCVLIGDIGRGQALCQEALALSEAHGDRWCAAHALWTQGLIAWRQGDLRQAAEQEIRCVRLREPFGDSWGIAMALELLAWVAGDEKQYERAARLLGILQATWRSIGASRPGSMDSEHQRCETRTRNALGQPAFEAAFGAGQAFPLSEAISYALGGKPGHGSGQPEPEAAAQLTRREAEIAGLIAEGLSNKEIAARLVIAQRTAEGHVEHILTKLGFSSRAQVAAWVARNR